MAEGKKEIKRTEILIDRRELDEIRRAFDLLKQTTHGRFMFDHNPTIRKADDRVRRLYARRIVH